MLRFIKGLMQKPSQVKEVRLKENEFAEWIDKEIDARQDSFSKEAVKMNNKIKETCNTGFKLLDELEEKNLENENIPEKEKNYMEGNRASFAKNTREFFNSLPEFHPEDFQDKMEQIKSKLSRLENANKKPYDILQHFFANEARKVMEKIHEVENYSNQLNEQYKEIGLPALENAREELKEEERREKANRELENSIKEKKQEVSELKEKLEDTKRKIAQLEERKDYAEYKELSKQKEQISEQIGREESNVESTLSNLKQPLKKNQRLTMDEELNERFVETPANALLNDTQRILKFFESLRKNIENDKIELKDKKKQKALSTIDSVNKEFIENFKEKHSELEEKRKDIDSKLRHNQVMMEYTDLVYKKEHLEERLGKAENELVSMQSKAEKTEGKTKEIVEKLNEGLPDKRIILE